MTNTEIRDFIENAIKENKVMLFMKGTPEQPACGFSMRTSGALNALGVQYAALDILPDPRIREELSGLSGWPTIPQLFIDGELVGGCDIVTEMYETGELAEKLGVEMPDDEDEPAPAEQARPTRGRSRSRTGWTSASAYGRRGPDRAACERRRRPLRPRSAYSRAWRRSAPSPPRAAPASAPRPSGSRARRGVPAGRRARSPTDPPPPGSWRAIRPAPPWRARLRARTGGRGTRGSGASRG